MWLEWYLAWHYLSSRSGARFLSLITLIAMGGICVGVMALIAVTSLMTGLQNDLRGKILAVNPHVWLTSDGAPRVEAWEPRIAALRGDPEVEAAAPAVQTDVGLRIPGGFTASGVLWGVEPRGEGPAATEIAEQIRTGALPLGGTASGHPPLLVGEVLANALGLYPGTIVSMTSIQHIPATPMGTLLPRIRSFEVAGHFRSGIYEFDASNLFTTLGAAQDLAGLGPAVSGFQIRVRDEMRADEAAARLARGAGATGFRAESWQTMHASLFSALQLEKLAMSLILSLIVFVAGINIVSTLVMMVASKTREIGILRSMGLRAGQVRRVFVLQGLIIGVVGSLLGAAGGVGLVVVLDRFELIRIPQDVYFIDRLPLDLRPLDLAVILASSLLIALLATIYPARQAAKLYPVEALRHD